MRFAQVQVLEEHHELTDLVKGQAGRVDQIGNLDEDLEAEFAPAKDAGNATLKLDRDTWVFNPRLNQVIKLPASMLS